MLSSIILHKKDLGKTFDLLLKERSSSRELIKRCLLISPFPNEGFVKVWGTDGASHLCVTLEAEFTGAEHPAFVVDSRSFRIAMRMDMDQFTLTHNEKGTFIYFGAADFLTIDTYAINHNIFERSGLLRPSKKWEMIRDEYLDALTRLKHLVEGSHVIPDLGYYFLGRGWAYAANGRLISRVGGIYPDLTLRAKDAKVLRVLLESQKVYAKEHIFLERYHNCYLVRFPTAQYIFPPIAHELSEEWKQGPVALDDFLEVSLPALRIRASILREIPDSLGTISVHLVEDGIVLRSQSKKGDESQFYLDAVKKGVVERTSVTVGADTLHTCISVLGDMETVKIGVSRRGLLQFFNGKVFQAMTGKIR